MNTCSTPPQYWVFLLAVLTAAFLSCATPPKTATPSGDETPPPVQPGTTAEMEIPPDEPETTEEVLTEISRFLGEGKYSDALSLFDKIESPDSESDEIQLIKASVFNTLGQSADARGIAEEIISREPENIDALLVLAASAAVDGKNRDQRSILEKVIKIDPAHTKALCDLGFMALSTQSLRTAAGYFDRALASDSDYGDALVGRAVTYRYGHEPQKAEQLLNKAIRLYPEWASPLNERARLYKGAGFAREALADLDKAKILEPDNGWIAVDRGMTLVDLNRKDEALEEFSRAIKIDPENFLAHVYSAGIKDERGDIAGAEQDYIALTRIKPEYYFAFEGLGMAKMRNEEWGAARDAFLEAYRYAPKEYSYALLAAINWMRAGQLNDPKQFLAQVLRSVPRESLEWYMLRLFHDLAGDNDIALRIDKETNFDNKARMLFYLANYYDIRGNKNLADRYFLQTREMNRQTTPEWRLNEWFIEQRGLAAF
ncbi:MAG TPA: hypothetical protein DEQ14_09340 [Treponema sp.]|nr:hypothetical protein [Treponema sp.]